VVSRVGRGRGVLHGVVIVEWEGTVLGVNVGHPIVTMGTLWHSLRVRSGDWGRGFSQIISKCLVKTQTTAAMPTKFCKTINASSWPVGGPKIHPS